MKKLKNHRFGKEALVYIQGELGNGWDLAASLLKWIPLDQGVISTYLPENIPASIASDFRISIYKTAGDSYWNEIESQIMTDIHVILGGKRNRYFIVESLAEEVSNSWKIKPGDYFKYLNWIYFFRTGSSDNNELRTIFRHSRDYPFIAIVTSLPEKTPPLHLGQVIDDRVMDELVKRVDMILIGVYDAEGLLIWKKREEN
jgi:hypothetical protein